MRGIATATAAVTVANALPTGVGCAIGIDLQATAVVDAVPADGASAEVEVVGSEATPLVREALARGLSTAFPARAMHVRLQVTSHIPPAVGLKSSSAVASSIYLAARRAAGHNPPADEVARASAEAGRAAGVSATGAYDDAYAGLVAGIVITDNRRDQVLDLGPVPAGLAVDLYVPEVPHRPAPEMSAAFRARASEVADLPGLLRERRWWDAMRRNSEFVESVLEYPYRAPRAELTAGGAVGVGVSGLGPTLVAVVPHDAPRLTVELPGHGRIVPRRRRFTEASALRTGGS